MSKKKKRKKFRLNLPENIARKIDSLKLLPGSTVLIHIGKCGGRSLKNGLTNATKNSRPHVVHIKQPVFRKDLKYIIVARGPIPRLISAFQWRYKLVVTDGTQRDRFDGEYDVLVKYRTLNNLAEALYHEVGSPNPVAHQEIRKIHHIREDIAFYLHDLLGKCQPDQIIAVLMQENLNNDIERVFGYKNEIRAHINPSPSKDKMLSETATENIKRFFKNDYDALEKLHQWGKIDSDIFAKLT